MINFAYKTFRWDSESAEKAAVHCVIIGFANFHREKKFIFDGDNKISANFINFYLDDAPNFFLTKRNKTLQKFIPPIKTGNQPIDGGNLILSEQEKNFLIKNFPVAEKFIKNFIGSEEFLHNKKRFCLWLVDATPAEIKKIPPIYERVKKVKEFRLKSSRKDTNKLAEIPTRFGFENLTKGNFIAIPEVSSENRKYIPIGFLSEENICSNLMKIISDANLFLFGILQSSVHMAWTRKFCGRLESRYRYSATLIYNNFPFPAVDKNQRDKTTATAEKILQVRKNYPDTCLADLYDENLMPKDLRDAHKKNDLAVLDAYGFDKNFSESEIISELMKLYQNMAK